MNLLRLFEFYLASMFVIGLVRRFEFYRAIVRLALALTRRHQKLFGVVRDQSTMLFTWSTLLPAVVTLLLWALQSLLTRLVFPHAELPFADVLSRWWFVPLVAIPVLGMLAVDSYFLICVGKIDVKETQKYFAQAEWWLNTWKAKAVKVVTFGKVNPHQMVHDEVQKALTSGGKLIHWALWWSAVQTGWRVAVGVSLWLVWTIGPSA